MTSNDILLQFPCQFPIKVIGKTDLELDLLVIEIIRRHVPNIDENALTSRPSRKGNYLSVTVTIEATSKPQLDAIYQDLSTCPAIIIAL